MSSTFSTISSVLSNYQSSRAAGGATDSYSSVLDQVRSINTPDIDFGVSYVLDLSQAAQVILSQQTGNTRGVYNGVRLSQGQIQRLETILSDYEAVEVNSVNINALHAELQDAGLLPRQLASIQAYSQYNADGIALSLLGSASSNTSNESSASSLAATLQRYKEISANQGGSALLNSSIKAYLDLLNQGAF